MSRAKWSRIVEVWIDVVRSQALDDLVDWPDGPHHEKYGVTSVTRDTTHFWGECYGVTLRMTLDFVSAPSSVICHISVTLLWCFERLFPMLIAQFSSNEKARPVSWR